MAIKRNKTPNLPLQRDDIDAGMIRRPIRSPGQNLTESLASKDMVTAIMLSSVSAMAVFPQAWIGVLPFAAGYYAWVASQKFHLPFKVPQNWGGKDYGAPQPGGRGYGNASGILYFGQDQASLEELWIENGDARRHGFFLGTTGSGKALPLNALVLTTRGWVFNGDLRPGDDLIHPFGGTTLVESIHPQGKIGAVRIWFSDGRHADCSLDHLWHVRARARADLAPADGFDDAGKLMTAGDIGLLSGLRGADLHLSIPFAKPHHGMDIPEGSSILSEDHAVRSAREGLHHLDYMPSLFGSPEQRIEFLRSWFRNADYGIEIEEYGVRLSHLDPANAKILKQIIWSLGGVATVYVKSSLKEQMKGVDLTLMFDGIDQIWPQAAHCRFPGCGDGLEIIEVERLEEDMEMSCIKTSREDGLYIMENHVVTHNTELLLGICSQTLMWSSGFLFIDGKGTTEFYARAWTLAKRFGREDDIRVLNFTDAGEDPDAPAGGPSVESNTLNPFAKGGSDQLMNLIVGLMGDAGAGNDMWKNRAMSLVTAAMKALVLMRDSGDILLDVQAIRDFLPLGTGVSKSLITGPPPKTISEVPEEAWQEMRTRGGMIELYLRAMKGDFSNAARLALKGFFDSLPGFSLEKALKGDAQADKASEQYNFLSMQLTKPLGSLADDYGHIFRTPLGEVDIDDVVLNRRILVVLLPALQKAPEEMQNCGKIVVNLVKIMMGNASGSQLSGSKRNIVDSKQTRAPSPFIVVLDEAGYYMVKGIDTMMAQARSLGFMIIVAGQDMAAMQSLSPQIAETAMANASIFAAGKITDAEKTLSAIQKMFGRTQVAVSSGYRAQSGLMSSKWVDRMDASFQDVEKVTVDELQHMMEGEFYFKFNGVLVRASTFYVGTVGKGGFGESFSVNKFIKVRGPTDRVPGLDQSVEIEFIAGYVAANERMMDISRGRGQEMKIDDDGLTAIKKASDSFLWMTGKKAGHPANIHGAWLGAIMEIDDIEEASGVTASDTDAWEDDVMPDGDAHIDEIDRLMSEDIPEGGLEEDLPPFLDDFKEDEPTARDRPRSGRQSARETLDDIISNDLTSEIGDSLKRGVRGRTPKDRHSGLIDLLLAQESACRKAMRNQEIDQLSESQSKARDDELDAQKRTIGDFFTMLAENGARFAKVFAEEEVDGDLGIEILRRSGNVRPLPLVGPKGENFMEDAVSDLEKILSTE